MASTKTTYPYLFCRAMEVSWAMGTCLFSSSPSVVIFLVGWRPSSSVQSGRWIAVSPAGVAVAGGSPRTGRRSTWCSTSCTAAAVAVAAEASARRAAWVAGGSACDGCSPGSIGCSQCSQRIRLCASSWKKYPLGVWWLWSERSVSFGIKKRNVWVCGWNTKLERKYTAARYMALCRVR